MPVDKPLDADAMPSGQEKLEIEIVPDEEALGAPAQETEPKRAASDDDEDDGSEEYGARVQKRIDKLTKRVREAERRAQEAEQRAERDRQQRNVATSHAQENILRNIEAQEARIEAERGRLEREFTVAFDEGDRTRLWKAQQEIAKVEAHAKALELYKSQHGFDRVQTNRAEPEPRVQQAAPQAAPVEIRPITKDWMSRNDWFGKDKKMTRLARAIDTELAEEGFDPGSEDYYAELDIRLRDSAPDKFPAAQPGGRRTAQPVGGVSRAPSANQKVRLTEREAELARRMGVPLAEYARYVKR